MTQRSAPDLIFRLGRESLDFQRDLAALARTYHFDYENEITTRRENYTDPVHIVTPSTSF